MIRAAFDDKAKAFSSRSPLPPLFTSTNVDKRYLPGRAILGSILVHTTVICGLLTISASADFKELKRPPLRVTMVNLKDPNYRLYLPVLMGADPPPASEPDRSSLSVESKPNLTSDDRTSRLSYPGPQPIVSDFPNPTNHIQTILQPTLTQPPVLPPPLMLPNVVRAPVVPPVIPQPKLAGALDPPDLPAPRFPTPPEMKSSELPVMATLSPIDLSKIALPVNSAETIPEIAPPQMAKLETKVPSAPVTASPTNPPNVPDAVAKRVEPLLVLSPMPSPPDDTV